MNQIFAALLFASLILPSLAAPALAAPPAPSARSSKLSTVYSVNRAGQAIGEIKETLEITAGQYRLESATIPVGVLAVFVKETIKQNSSGTHGASGFRPEQFSYHRTNKTSKNLDARFDWGSQTATFNFDGKTESQPLPKQLQDRLSLAYQFRYWPKGKDRLVLPISNGKSITEYTIVRAGEEMLTVPAGRFQTTRYTRQLTPDDDGITVWVSSKLAAPIKITVEEKKGVYTEQVLTRVMSE